MTDPLATQVRLALLALLVLLVRLDRLAPQDPLVNKVLTDPLVIRVRQEDKVLMDRPDGPAILA